MKGFLFKPGKRLKLRVLRFFTLEGTELSSHRADGASATWTVDIADAILTGNDESLEIVVEIPDVKTVVLYADSVDSFAKWMHALENAVSRKFERYYEIGDQIATSALALIKSAKNRLTGETCAVKFMEKYECEGRCGGEELRSMISLRHPNIIRTTDVFESDYQFIVVMERIAQGSIFHALSNQNPSEKMLCRLFKQILEGLQYLHANGVTHSNLKPDNVLLAGDPLSYTVKLTDCGICNWIRVEEDGDAPEIQVVSDHAFVAPEVLNMTGFSEKMDSWSAGVLLYHMLTGQNPLPDPSDSSVNVTKQSLANTSEEAVELLRGLLEPEPTKRLSVEDALKSTWIKSVDELSSAPIGIKLHSPKPQDKMTTRKMPLKDTDRHSAMKNSFQTAGSFKRHTPDSLVYGSRAVNDPAAFSVNRDPWGGKAAASQSKGLMRASRSFAKKPQKQASMGHAGRSGSLDKGRRTSRSFSFRGGGRKSIG